jgi:hypothetical protein
MSDLERVTPDQYANLKKLDYPIGNGRRNAPFNAEVVKWLRDEHKIAIEVQLDRTSNMKWAVAVCKWNGIDEFINIPTWEGEGGWLYRRYEEAENWGIEMAIKYLLGIDQEKE